MTDNRDARCLSRWWRAFHIPEINISDEVGVSHTAPIMIYMNNTATNAGQALKELLETEAAVLNNHGPALSHGAHTHDLRGRSLNRAAALDLKMLEAAHEAHSARWDVAWC